MIKTNKLIKKYNKRCVVNEVSLDMKKGEIVGLLGPNGAGKTTTFYMITGLIKPDGGSITFNNNDITKLPMYKRSRLGLGYLPQESSIFKKLTVQENVFILWEQLNNVPKKDYEKKLNELLDEMGILHLKNSKGLQLSGGEKEELKLLEH